MSDNNDLNPNDISLFGNVDSFVGITLNENYQITELLGESNNNLTYLAKNLNNKNIPDLIIVKKANPNFIKRIQTIKKMASLLSPLVNLKHPNILESYEYIFDKNDNFYQILQYLRNAISLKEFKKNQTNLKKTDLIRIINQISDGLSFLHDHNIIHGDLKPSNILCQTDQNSETNIRICDALIAKLINDQDQDANHITLSKEQFINPQYSSPEIFQGKPANKSSDIYSLGCIIYELITGDPPFNSQNITSNYASHLNDLPQSFPLTLTQSSNFIARIESLTFKALDKNPSNRYLNVTDVKNDLALAFVASEEVWQSKAIALKQNETTQSKLGRATLPSINLKTEKPKRVNVNWEKIILNTGVFAIICALGFYGYSIVINQDNLYKNLNTNLLFIPNLDSSKNATVNNNDEIEKSKINLQEVADECTKNSLQYLNALNQLGVNYYKANKFVEASDTYLEIKKIATSLKNNEFIILAIKKLAWINYLNHDYQGDLNYCQEALNMIKANPNSPYLWDAYMLLGNTYTISNEPKIALDYYAKLYQSMYPYRFRISNSFAIAGFQLADTYRKLNRYKEACQIFKYCISNWQFVVRNPNHPLIAHAYYSLGLTLMAQGNYAEAIEALTTCKKICQKLNLPKSSFKSAIDHSYLTCLWHTNILQALFMVLGIKSNLP